MKRKNNVIELEAAVCVLSHGFRSTASGERGEIYTLGIFHKSLLFCLDRKLHVCVCVCATLLDYSFLYE